VLDAPGHDEELAGAEFDVPVAEAEGHPPGDDEEQLVLELVPVPDELSPELRRPDLLAVQLADDPRAPGVVEPGELLGEVDLVQDGVTFGPGIGRGGFGGVQGWPRRPFPARIRPA
jgi:hypothetical protein